MKKYLLIFGLILTQQALADVYLCREKTTITFVDAVTKENFKHCVLMTEHKVTPSSEPPKKIASNQTIQAVKVDPQTQEVRDSKRKQILLAELKTEEDALQSSRNAGMANDERLHQKNIELLHKEIQRLK